MSSLKRRIKSAINQLILAAVIALPIQGPTWANTDEQKLIALSNWASVAFPALFLRDYSGPAQGFGYLYTCFTNINCIGIQNDQIDVLLNGNIVSVGSVADLSNTMTSSNNGIINFSGLAVDAQTIPATFSPGYGEITDVTGQFITITWKMMTLERTQQQQIHDFSVIINTANPTTLVNVTLTSQEGAGKNFHQWSLFANTAAGIAEINVDASKGTLEISDELTLPKISGGNNILTILKGGNLKLRF